MKKMSLLAVLAAAVCLMGCEKTETPDNGNNNGGGNQGNIEITISVSPIVVEFDAEGGTRRATVETNQADYSVSGAPEWLSVEKNGKELTLTATANTVNQPRSCDLLITAGVMTTTLPVNQKAGSAYAGYASLASAVLEYSGTMLYQFLKPQEEDFGGQAMISLADQDGNGLNIWVYTELFESEEEVELTPGTYVKGQDAFPVLYAKPLTFAAGVVQEDEEDGISVMGSFFAPVTTEVPVALVDGTVEVVAGENGKYTIKVDMADAAGNAYKYVYEGEVKIDAQGATYPGESDRIDVANTVFAAECYYEGDTYENGTSNFILQLYSGSEEDYATTTFEFNMASVEFSENMDLSGEYAFPENEEGYYAAGTLVPGVLIPITETFSFPMGTFIMYGVGEYLVGDGYATLSLTKQNDGKYTLVGVIMSQEEEMVMFTGSDFTGIHDLEITLIDSTAIDDED